MTPPAQESPQSPFSPTTQHAQGWRVVLGDRLRDGEAEAEEEALAERDGLVEALLEGEPDGEALVEAERLGETLVEALTLGL